MVSWSLKSEEFCTVGPRTALFWNLSGKPPKKGVFGGPDKITNFACVTYDSTGFAYTGG